MINFYLNVTFYICISDISNSLVWMMPGNIISKNYYLIRLFVENNNDYLAKMCNFNYPF